METLLVKIFATALALSQVMTTPNASRPSSTAQSDQPQVAQILQAGCTHMLKAFAIEDINIDDLIATAMDDPQAIGSAKALRGINFDDLLTAYRQFCKNEKVAQSGGRSRRRDRLLQRGGGRPAGPHQAQGSPSFPARASCWTARTSASPRCSRRTSAASGCRSREIPQHVRNAFIAAEDKRFYQHKGIDEHGLIRAFVGNLAQSRPAAGRLDHHPAGRQEPAGRRGPHLRAQDPRDDRRRAARSRTLTKDEILELYLNSVFLGRGAWGVEVAAHSYFGKPAKALTARRRRAARRPRPRDRPISAPIVHPRARGAPRLRAHRMREDGMLPADFKSEDRGPLPALPV